MLWFIEEGMALTFKGNRFDEFLSVLNDEKCHVSILPRNLWDPPVDFTTLDPNEPTILYTSIDLGKQYHDQSKIQNLPKPGVWFDHELLSCLSYYTHLKEYLFNKDYIYCAFRRLSHFNWFVNRERIFIRPERNEKRKLFVGQSLNKDEYKSWLAYNHGHVDPNAMCIVASDKKIDHEWRLIIDQHGKVVSGSLYKTDGNLTYKGGYPDNVKEFAEKVASVWSPHPVWCLDIGECGDKLGIVELSTINCSGWYDSELLPIVRAINDAILNPIGERK